MRPFILRTATVAPVALLLAACWNRGALDVPNINNPDVARTYALPAGVEAVISSTYQQIWAATVGCTGCINTEAHCLSLENYSELNNFSMNVRSLMPRAAIVNDRTGNAGANGVYSTLEKAARSAANGMQAVARLKEASVLVPPNALGSPAQDARARSFGFFTTGIALGGLAMIYDSAAIVTPSTPSDEVPPLSGYVQVMTAALAMFDSAQAAAGSPDATNIGNAPGSGFPLPNTWIYQNALSQADFIRLIRTYKARYRAAVARTPAERAAVDWAAVIADAQAGISADFKILISTSAGWRAQYDVEQMYSQGWSGISQMIYGMADTSGAYANFIATPLATRDGGFLIRTPDLRFPQGATRAAQQADAPLPLPGRRYIANQAAGDDNPVSGYGFSYYQNRRWYPIRSASNNGNYTAINKVEMDMLLAEGYIRTGNFAAATPLIDASRTKSGLPAIGAITSLSQAIAGGSACVPRVPQAPGFNTVACGNIMEAMKWEKRMETAFSCQFACWYTDSRGWGDLPQNTALMWAVPYQEMDARVQPFYSFGGGNPGSAAKGTYGF
jgi:hypothetical protein